MHSLLAESVGTDLQFPLCSFAAVVQPFTKRSKVHGYNMIDRGSQQYGDGKLMNKNKLETINCGLVWQHPKHTFSSQLICIACYCSTLCNMTTLKLKPRGESNSGSLRTTTHASREFKVIFKDFECIFNKHNRIKNEKQ